MKKICFYLTIFIYSYGLAIIGYKHFSYFPYYVLFILVTSVVGSFLFTRIAKIINL